MVVAPDLTREHACKGRLQEPRRHRLEGPLCGKPFDRSGSRGACRSRLSVPEVLERAREWDETFLGRQAIEGVETRKIALAHPPVFSISYHSAGRWILYPWSYTPLPTPADDRLSSFAAHMAAANR